MAKTLPLNDEAYREFIDPLTGDHCRRDSIVDIRLEVRPKGRVGHVRVEYIERGIGSGRRRPLSIVTDVADVMDGSIWRQEFRIDLLDHDAEFAHLAVCLGADPQALADIIRAHAPR